jgi:hypothetical protein
VWESAVKGGREYDKERPWLPKSMIVLKAAPAERATFRKDGGHWIVKKGIHKVAVRAEGELKEVSDALDAALEIVGETAYIAFHGLTGSSYPIYAIERTTGRVTWRSDVWAGGDLPDMGGSSVHVVFIRSAGDNLVLYGVGMAAYIEILDRKTGDNICRLSTYYFFDRDRK